MGKQDNVEFFSGIGDYVRAFLVELVDDSSDGVYEGEGNDTNFGSNPGRFLISDEFGESLEENYLLDPDPETRQYVENIARGVYQIGDDIGWENHMALTGTIENPEIRITDLETVNQVRKEQAYDQVRERVTVSAS